MIARVWRGSTRAAHADDYLRHLKTRVLPELSSIGGHRGVDVLRRPHDDGVEFVVITWWESIDAIRSFAGPDVERAVVPAEAQALLEEYDRRARHYELAATHRQSRSVP
jgi:heme-degrading monooxygenase HmoA